jgi:hypothetical protein
VRNVRLFGAVAISIVIAGCSSSSNSVTSADPAGVYAPADRATAGMMPTTVPTAGTTTTNSATITETTVAEVPDRITVTASVEENTTSITRARLSRRSAPPTRAAPAPPVAAVAPPPPAPVQTSVRSNEAIFREQLERESRDLNPARFAWNPPKQAKAYVPMVVTYRIAPKGAPGNVAEGLGPNAERFDDTVSTRVAADLVGPAFTVDRLDPKDRVLRPGKAEEWHWRITPIESGERQPLTLNTTLTLTISDRDVPLPMQPRVNYVAVSSNPVGWAQHHWEWLMTAVILPAAGYGGKQWLGRGKPAAKQT